MTFFQVWIRDVEREILREKEENRVEEGGKTQADPRSDQKQRRRGRGGRRKPRLSKRETLLEMLMGAVVGAGGSRRPRKIQEEGGTSNLQQEGRGACYQRCKYTIE